MATPISRSGSGDNGQRDHPPRRLRADRGCDGAVGRALTPETSETARVVWAVVTAVLMFWAGSRIA